MTKPKTRRRTNKVPTKNPEVVTIEPQKLEEVFARLSVSQIRS